MYEPPAGKRIRRLPDASVLGWFQRMWTATAEVVDIGDEGEAYRSVRQQLGAETEHLAQLALHTSHAGRAYHFSWVMFDDLWAGAHPDLARGMLRGQRLGSVPAVTDPWVLLVAWLQGSKPSRRGWLDLAGITVSTRLGRHRWRVERSLSWLSRYRRLAIRWDRDSARFFAFVLLACALVCFKRL